MNPTFFLLIQFRLPGIKSDFITALEVCFSSSNSSDLITVSNLKYLSINEVKVIRVNAIKGSFFCKFTCFELELFNNMTNPLHWIPSRKTKLIMTRSNND